MNKNNSPAPWQQIFADFRRNCLVLYVHREQDGQFKLGRRASSDANGDSDRAQLLAEYRQRSPGRETEMLCSFESTLAKSPITADVVLLSGHTVHGKHLILCGLDRLPPDVFHRLYEFERLEALARGDSIHFDGTTADPRDRLLRRRNAALHGAPDDLVREALSA